MYSNTHTFEGNRQEVPITLTDEMQKTGEIGNNKKRPDIGEYWWESYQEIFAEVIFLYKSARSQVINVDLNTEPKKPENVASTSIVGPSPKTQKRDKEKCPNCEKDIVTFHIYASGKIEKHIPKTIKEEYKQKYKYVYHDKDGKEHVLGIFNVKTTTRISPGNKIGTGSIELVDVREFKGYTSNNVKLNFKTFNTESERYYINPDCYAGLLGAMANLNIDYIGFNGFSNYEGKSTGGSQSHRNGEKGDLRYLSIYKKGEITYLSNSHFDIITQNKFNNELYNFGWGRLEKMYSEYFTHKGNKTYLLNHTKHMRKDGKGRYRHHHHLHLTGFDHSLIKIINEK